MVEQKKVARKRKKELQRRGMEWVGAVSTRGDGAGRHADQEYVTLYDDQ